jgi:hypothetical protein
VNRNGQHQRWFAYRLGSVDGGFAIRPRYARNASGTSLLTGILYVDGACVQCALLTTTTSVVNSLRPARIPFDLAQVHRVERTSDVVQYPRGGCDVARERVDLDFGNSGP